MVYPAILLNREGNVIDKGSQSLATLSIQAVILAGDERHKSGCTPNVFIFWLK